MLIFKQLFLNKKQLFFVQKKNNQNGCDNIEKILLLSHSQ